MALILEQRTVGQTPQTVTEAACIDGYFDVGGSFFGPLTLGQAQLLAKASSGLPLEERMYALRV